MDFEKINDICKELKEIYDAPEKKNIYICEGLNKIHEATDKIIETKMQLLLFGPR
jgi:hypothetical protein